MNWKLTQKVIGEPEVETFRDDPDEDLTAGFSLLRSLSPDFQFRELEPGVYYWRKRSTDEGFH